MRLLHYTEKPFAYDPHFEYVQVEPHAYGKPVGLWVSCEGEDDWPTWCRSEDWGVAYLANVSEITLHADANILYVCSAEQLISFHQEYGIPSGYDFLGHSIDWQRVTSEWDGIIIAPYLWGMRLSREVPWYYTWDCASGCIWNLDVITTVLPANKALEPIKTKELTQ